VSTVATWGLDDRTMRAEKRAKASSKRPSVSRIVNTRSMTNHAHTLPLALPGWLVTTYQLDLAANYSTGWTFHHSDVSFSPDGDMYVLSGVGRYVPGGDHAEDPAERTFRCDLVTRYGADGAPLATAITGIPDPEGNPSAVAWRGVGSLCVLPDGTVALTGGADDTYLLDAELRTLLGACTRPSFTMEESEFDEPFGDSFAGRIRVTSGGRLLCALDEYGPNGRGLLSPNLVALTDAGLTPTSRPDVEVIASVDGNPLHQTTEHIRSFAFHRGRRVGYDHRPTPDLAELAERRWPDVDWNDRPATLGFSPEPLSDELFVVPLLGHERRSGSRGQPFVFALIDDSGELVGRLGGLDYWKNSPFTGRNFTVVTDQERQLAFHANQYGLYAWSAEGTLLVTVSTEDKPFKVLANFALLGCSPAGELVFAHRRQHLLLRVLVPDTVGELASSVEAALRTYARERSRLKKALGPNNWHWTYTPGSVALSHL
jgi:hypothetical protein